MENISFFTQGAKSLGLKDTQTFTSKELHQKGGRIRDVAITLYWLGRAARGVPTYKGPHLNLNAFLAQKMKCSGCKKNIEDNNYLATMDQQWHRQCATCCKCKCALNPKETFYQLGNDIYCPGCMVATNSTGGHGTGPGLGTGTAHGHGGHSHGANDSCGKCHKSLQNVPHIHGDDGKDYCTNCICDICHNPVTGKEIIKAGKKICLDCICNECQTPFDENGYFEKNNKKVCPKCVNKPSSGNSTGKPVPTKTSVGNTPVKANAVSKGESGCRNCHKPIGVGKKSGHDLDHYCDPCGKDHCCGKCGDEISGQAVGALGKNYHPNCFNCVSCNGNIPTKMGGKFQQSGGNAYCNPCYDKVNNKLGNCSGCGKAMTKDGFEALGKNWHPQCFNCSKCHKTFPTGEFSEYENKPYCAGCVPMEGTDICYGCKKPLSGEVAAVYNHFWHKGCFKCCGCAKPFLKGYTVWENLPYCEPCHLERSADRCQLCAKPMVGQAIKVKGKQWHKSCFYCSVCKKDISNTNENPEVFIKFSKPYCRTCNPPANVAKFCTGCGTPAGGGKFCNKCGHTL